MKNLIYILISILERMTKGNLSNLFFALQTFLSILEEFKIIDLDNVKQKKGGDRKQKKRKKRKQKKGGKRRRKMAGKRKKKKKIKKVR